MKQLWVRRDIDAPAAVLWEFNVTLGWGGHAGSKISSFLATASSRATSASASPARSLR